jgi:drug/metabolite transporter (DMT)-like permease
MMKKKNKSLCRPTADGEITGTICVFLASVFFSIGGLCVKLIPWSALAINGARNLIGAAVIGVFLLVTGHAVRLNRPVLIGALSTIGVTTLFTIANKLTTAANAIVLQFTAPVFVIVLMAALFHKKPKQRELLTCAVVFFGVLLFFVDGLQTGNLLGDLLAVLSGVCYAGVFLMNTAKGADALSSCFLGQLAAGIAFSPFCLGEKDFSIPVVSAVLLLGVVQVGAAYILLSIGIRCTGAVTASLMTGLEPVLNPLWVALFYGERISSLAMVGAVIVVGGIVLYQVSMAKGSNDRNRKETLL